MPLMNDVTQSVRIRKYIVSMKVCTVQTILHREGGLMRSRDSHVTHG